MARAGVSSLVLVLVLVVVLVLAASEAAAGVARRGTDCCPGAQGVCHCTGQGPVVLETGSISNTVRKIVIRHSSRVTLKRGFFDDLMSVISITFQNLEYLEFGEYSLYLLRKANLASVVAENVSKIEIKDWAFSGFWGRRAEMTFKSVGHLLIGENGFSFDSSDGGPELSFQDIAEVSLSVAALSARIHRVTVSDVNSLSCRRASFGRRLGRIEMNNVVMGQLRPRSIDSDGTLDRLSFTDCRIGELQPDSTRGYIEEVRIHNTTVDELREQAFNITVDHMHVSDSSIGDLFPKAVGVAARRSLLWERVTIARLREHAFINAWVEGERDRAGDEFIFRALHVARADRGSLQFGSGTHPSIDHLNVTVPAESRCRIADWSRGLLGIPDGARSLSDPQRLLLSQISQQNPDDPSSCPPDDTTSPQRPQSTRSSEERVTTVAPGKPSTDDGQPRQVRWDGAPDASESVSGASGNGSDASGSVSGASGSVSGASGSAFAVKVTMLALGLLALVVLTAAVVVAVFLVASHQRENASRRPSV